MSNSRDRGQFRQDRVDPDLSKVIEGTVCEIILEDTLVKIVEGSIGMIITGIVAIV